MILPIPQHNRILILGASGFIGNTLYKELLPYFDVYGTYANSEDTYHDNKVFFKFKAEEDSILDILKEVRPTIIVSCCKGPQEALLKTHKILCDYIWAVQGKLVFISSAAVFDAKGKYPSYENDIPLSETLEGKHKIALEKIIKELPEENYCIVRLPLVLGVNSTTIQQLKQAIQHHAAFEIHPNWVISVNTDKKVAQQIHYLINQDLQGIFHLASEDVSHHDDIFKEISRKISHKSPIFKNVFSSNEDRYLAILPKENKLPKNYRITVEEVISDSTLKDAITTLKK